MLNFSEDMYIQVFTLLNTERVQRRTSEAKGWESLPGSPGRNAACAAVDGVFPSIWKESACFQDNLAVFLLCTSLYLPAFPKTDSKNNNI